MTQFKDKSGIQDNGATEKISVGAGLLNYPVLMAADILLYNANVVPVGEDQTQHIEITRTLARRFNKKFAEVFTIPNIYTSPAGKKIMALDDPLKKMSKSAEAVNSRIELLDEPDVIRKKIMKATTDSENKIYYSDDPEKAGLKNLLNIFSIITNTTPEQIAENYKSKGYGDFKKDLAEEMVNYLKPIQDKFNNLSDEEVLKIFAKSKTKLTTQAHQNITKIKKAMGLE
jgi:tryptophanyl-tRNA synthetase